MKKHIVTPATAEEIGRALKVTRKDREIVEKAFREIGEYETEPFSEGQVVSTGKDLCNKFPP